MFLDAPASQVCMCLCGCRARAAVMAFAGCDTVGVMTCQVFVRHNAHVACCSSVFDI